MTNLDYLYNPKVAKTAFEQNYFIDKKLGFSVIENGMILPYKRKVMNKPTNLWGAGGIVDGEGNYIKSSFVSQYLICQAYTPPSETIRYSSETVIYLGMFLNVWGHDLTDNIRRIWFLKSDAFKSEFKNCRLVYVQVKGRGCDFKYDYAFHRLLEILEVDINKLNIIERPTRFDKIILPEESFCLDNIRNFTNEYREMIYRIRNFAMKNSTPTFDKKIYYFHGVRQMGEERLAEYFKSKGYAIVSPEKLTLDEQLNILINAESFASTLGSCAHNSIFLRDGTETIFIPRLVNRLTYHQPLLNQVNQVNAHFIDSTLSIFAKSQGPYLYIISSQLKEFFGDKFDGYSEEDFNIFLQYCKNCIGRGLTANLKQLKDYGKFFQDFCEQFKQREDLMVALNIKPDGSSLLTYKTHVHKNGWGTWKTENKISNPLNQKFDIQAIKIALDGYEVYYSVYFNETEGWSKEVAAPKQAGTTGKHKSIFGIKIRLDEAGAKKFDILYRLHNFDGNWTPWAKNGENLLSDGVKLNAIQIKLEPKT